MSKMRTNKKSTKRQGFLNREAVPVIQYIVRGRKVKKFPSITEASYHTGVNTGSISKVTRGICDTAGGFRWEATN